MATNLAEEAWVIRSSGGDAYTFWARIKFTGRPAFPHPRAGEKNAIYIERVALEKNVPTGPVAREVPRLARTSNIRSV